MREIELGGAFEVENPDLGSISNLGLSLPVTAHSQGLNPLTCLSLWWNGGVAIPL